MQNLTKKQILALSAALFLGFTCGFAGRDIFDHSGSAKASEPIAVPVKKVADPAANISLNKLLGPNLWHINVDPFWHPLDLALEPVVTPEFLGMPLDVPKVKTIDGDKEIQVVAEVPGMSEKDVDVQAGKNTVTISGHRKETSGDDGKNGKKSFSTVEQSFTRTVSLPVEVDGDKVKATIKDGVLTVSIPKAKSTKAI